VEVFEAALLLQILLLVTSRHGQYRKHCSTIVVLVSVVAETCLPNCCLETAFITPFFHYCVRVNCGRYLATAAFTESPLSNESIHHNVYIFFTCIISDYVLLLDRESRVVHRWFCKEISTIFSIHPPRRIVPFP
jgi:hypothetical protein